MDTLSDTPKQAVHTEPKNATKNQTTINTSSTTITSRQIRQIYGTSRTLEVSSPKNIMGGGHQPATPKTISLKLKGQSNDQVDQLFIDHIPIASQNWNYQHDSATLTFKQIIQGKPLKGSIYLNADKVVGTCLFEVDGVSVGSQIHAKPVTYDMKVAQDAAYVSGTSVAPQLNYDPTSSRWQEAAWPTDNNMQFTYGIDGTTIIAGQTVYLMKVIFKDLDTQETWEPKLGNYTAYLDANNNLQFNLNSGLTPVPDPYNPMKQFTSKKFPYIFMGVLSGGYRTFNAAMLSEKRDLDGTSYGCEGTYNPNVHIGMFAVSHDNTKKAKQQSLLSIINGQVNIDGRPAKQTQILGNIVHWQGLDAVTQSNTGLPEDGFLELSPVGNKVLDGSNGLKGKAIHTDTAIARRADFAHQTATHNDLENSLVEFDESSHTLMDLINMDQFQSDDNGKYDAVQNQSMNDFYQILQYYMPKDLRETFINPNPISLDPTIKGIAQMPGKNGGNPDDWYSGLAVAYITGTVSHWDNDPASKYLNEIRSNKWLKNQVSSSDVFDVQGPALYGNRWQTDPSNGSLNDITWFLTDQVNNASHYETLIDQDAVSWKAEIQETVEGTEESIQKLLDQVDEITAYAKEKKQYWAFAMFKYSVSPIFLNALQAISFNPDPNVDGSVFLQRVQRTSAVLNVLDKTNFFDREFAKTMQIFQVSNILPQLLDYSGDLDEYSYAVNAIVTKFIETYIDSPDPHMKEAAEALQQAQQQGYMADILQIFQQTSVALGGLFTWGRLASTFESNCAKYVAKGLPEFAVKGVALAAMSFMIIGFATGSLKWKDLTGMQQATLIGYGVGLVAQASMMILKRGIALEAVLEADAGFWQGAKQFFSSKLLTEAQERNMTGIRRWLIEDGVKPATNSLEAEGLLAERSVVEGEEAELTFTRRLFGRNLDEFLATRFGAISAIFGIVMSIYFLVESTQPLEIAANALFLAASTLELIATGGGWALSAFGAEAAMVGGLAVSTLLSVVAVIGVLAMVAGAILLIIFLTQKRPSPVEQFAKGKAKDAGFYMPYGTEIDYFEVFQPEGQDQRAGISLKQHGTDRVLTMDSDGTVLVGAQTHTAHTAFYMVVDDIGRARFISPMTDDNGHFATKVLTMGTDGSLKAEDPITDNDNDDLSRQLWYANMEDEASYVDEHLSSAPFSLYNAYAKEKNNEKRYLYLDEAHAGLSNDSCKIDLTMVVTSPSGLSMQDISLFTYNRDVSQQPALIMPGSAPRTWSILPSLPSFMTLDTTTGTVSQKKGVAPEVMAKTSYTLTLTNAIGTVSDSFNLEVLQQTVS
ncbi:hypothetical protein [Bermanella sp. R86510]|uniref:hypothetical protein n=1 Tax=unclassified Bermanella TaxID=2627862 RepID=UPI0037CC4BBD